MLCSESSADAKTVAAKIISAVRHPDVKDSSPDWTRVVKRALREYGEEKGLAVYPNAAKSGRQFREWLLDVVWYNQTTGSLSLAVESEWGADGDVLDDFGKLLCVKAPLKVMIYFAYQGSLIPSFEEDVSAFDHHVKGEQYLVIEFHGTKELAYLYQTSADGKVSAPKFSELSLTHTPLAHKPTQPHFPKRDKNPLDKS